MIGYRRRKTCRLCESANIALVLPLKPTPLADAYVPADKLKEKQPLFPLDLFLCLDCGHGQILDVVDPEVLFRNYIYTSVSSPGLVDHFRAYASKLVERFRPAPGSLAVDIGSNDGTLLRFLKGSGMKVLGVDPAREVAARATASGVRTVPEFFGSGIGAKLAREEGRAQFVTANNVFAHSDSLGDMADGVRELLAPDGVFAFEVSYLADLVGGLVFDFVYHEHLGYHSVKPLRSFLARHGLELFDAQRIASKGGSLRCFAQRAGGPRKIDPSVAALLKLEDEMGLDRVDVYRALEKKVNGLRDELLDMLKKGRNAGRRVAGYGASATVTTLLYHYELGPYIEFLIDDNPERQGLYSPGLHLPVLGPKALLEKKPDDVVVLAWRFARPILAGNEAYRKGGGRFIVPLPELKAA